MDILNKDKVTFKDLEQLIYEIKCQEARELTASILNAIDDRLHQDRDKGEYRDKGLRKTTIKTVYGEVEYVRHIYLTRNEDGKNTAIFLLDKELGMDTIGLISTNLAEKIAEEYYEIPKEERNGKCSISISTSFFVPKPFTPFQWAVMYDPGDYLGFASTVNHEVKDMKNHKSIRYNWHEAYVTVLEGLLARGDRRVGAAIEEAYRQGALFDAWSEYWDWDRWVSAMEKTGVDLAFYTKRQRTEDELLPWDFIDCGATKKFLLDEWHRALDGIVTPNCRENCNACGAMKYKCGICYDEVDGKKVLRI